MLSLLFHLLCHTSKTPKLKGSYCQITSSTINCKASYHHTPWDQIFPTRNVPNRHTPAFGYTMLQKHTKNIQKHMNIMTLRSSELHISLLFPLSLPWLRLRPRRLRLRRRSVGRGVGLRCFGAAEDPQGALEVAGQIAWPRTETVGDGNEREPVLLRPKGRSMDGHEKRWGKCLLS